MRKMKTKAGNLKKMNEKRRTGLRVTGLKKKIRKWKPLNER